MTEPDLPARRGDGIDQIDTPALVLDADAFEANLQRMAQATTRLGIRLRPHAKAHKCPEIARRQIALGAIGICCQKVSEAEVFVNAGVEDVLVTNQIVGARKIWRLVQLARRARVGVLADEAGNVLALGAEALLQETDLDVYIEIEVGMGRCGVAPGAPAVALACAIAAQPRLRLAGLHCYQGAAQHLRSAAERSAAIAQAGQLADESRRALEAAGFSIPVITGAGTGTFPLERDSGIYNELQPGSYVFMDGDYARNQAANWDIGLAQSLYVLSSVMSRPNASRAVVDAGLKALSVDSGVPTVTGCRGAEYVRASDEHGVLQLAPGTALAAGARVWLVPGHCDPTANLYDWLVVLRGNVVEDIWPIAARGMLR